MVSRGRTSKKKKGSLKQKASNAVRPRVCFSLSFYARAKTRHQGHYCHCHCHCKKRAKALKGALEGGIIIIQQNTAEPVRAAYVGILCYCACTLQT
jgi:hypothetical protein